MPNKLSPELIQMASRPLTSSETAILERLERKKEVKISNSSAPQDFFIGNSSTATIRAALRDHKPFQLWPDQVLSFNKGGDFGVNVAAVAHHIEAEIIAPACVPEFEKLATGETKSFELKDYLQHKGYLGVGGKSEIPEETYIAFTAQKINALVLSELIAIASTEKPSPGFSVTRWGTDEGDWD